MTRTAENIVASASPSPDPEPAYSNVSYGPHERNVLDYWRPRGKGPAPLVIYIHGGGFRSGDKHGINQDLLTLSLNAGYAVAAINYRLSHHAPSPAFYYDGARAIQFLRHKAPEWNFEPARIAACGSSAGAGIALWVGFHDDLADPKSSDPVARQSTRVCCMFIVNGQSSYDPRFFIQHGLAPATKHHFIAPFYAIPRDQYGTPEAIRKFEEGSPINYVTADDPPVLAIYKQANDPVPNVEIAPNDPTYPGEKVVSHPLCGIAIHHPKFGLVLKEKLDPLGIECTVLTSTTTEDAKTRSTIADFFKRHLEPASI
jgi:acetyl esterase